MSGSGLRTLFVTPTWLATGETATALALAESVAAEGHEVWFLASPPAAQIVRPKFPDRVREMGSDIGANQVLWRRTVAALRPEVVIFSELRSLLFLRLNRQCPLADLPWLKELDALEAVLVAIDHIGSTLAVEDLMARSEEHLLGRLAAARWKPILERMSSLLACPLHEAGPVAGRRGVPYRSMRLPLTIDPEERARVRTRYLGDGQRNEGFLIFHSVPRWSYKLARDWKAPLYDHLSAILRAYLTDLPKKVTLVSVNDGLLLRPSGHPDLRVVNLRSLPLVEFEALLLSSDLLMTENIISLTTTRTLCHVPAVVLTNTFSLQEILDREGRDSDLGRVVLEMEKGHVGSVYPHALYPFMSADGALSWPPSRERLINTHLPSIPVPKSLIRLGDTPSSPYLRTELYGGAETRAFLRRILCDEEARREVRERDREYVERLNRLEDGITVLKRVAAAGPGGATGATVLPAA